MPSADATPALQPVPALHFDTAGLPARDNFDAWRAIMGEIYEVLPSTFENEAAFRAKLSLWSLAGIHVTEGTFSPQQFARSARRVRRDGFDHYTVLLHRGGQWLADTGDRSIKSADGRLCILDFARPVVTDVTWNDSITLSRPREMLDRVLPPRDLHGLTPDGAGAGLLRDFMVSLTSRIGDLTVSEAPHVAAACSNLLAACLTPSRATIANAQPELEAMAYRRAKQLIDANLHNPRWGAEELRLALGISRSTLYRVFERFGGVAEHIRARRLVRAHDLLTETQGQRRVSEIARLCGFANDTHFSRAFRQAYGYTAREAMAFGASGPPVRHGDGGAPHGEAATYIDWIRRLGG
jgi:AraC-like DNA-binding protein